MGHERVYVSYANKVASIYATFRAISLNIKNSIASNVSDTQRLNFILNRWQTYIIKKPMQDSKEFEEERNKSSSIIPYSSIQIYAELKDYEYALRALATAKEVDRPALNQSVYSLPLIMRQIAALFKGAQGQLAEMISTVSVRTAWSLFFYVGNGMCEFPLLGPQPSQGLRGFNDEYQYTRHGAHCEGTRTRSCARRH